MNIDDFSDTNLISHLGTSWQAVSDQVMGGISDCSLCHSILAGRPCLHITGDVHMENKGGFIQASLNLSTRNQPLDASLFTGIRMCIMGNGDDYSTHLRTTDLQRPWESYRAHFSSTPNWQTIDLPFSSFQPHRTDSPLNRSRLIRIGLVAIGRKFHADIAISQLSLYT